MINDIMAAQEAREEERKNLSREDREIIAIEKIADSLEILCDNNQGVPVRLVNISGHLELLSQAAAKYLRES